MELSELHALSVGRIPGWQYDHQVQPLGQLRVPSGRLEACDPFVTLGEGFVLSIPPGDYPAYVTIVDVSDEQDGSHLRESYLSLVLADGEASRVEYLVPEGADPNDADDSSDDDDDDESFYGVGVDAGTVAFVDADAVGSCMPEQDRYEDLFDNGTDDCWFAIMDSPAHYREGVANIVLPKATAGENLVLSHSGWGDGSYPVLGVYDAAGKMLAVHIDLLVEEREGSEEEDD